MKCPEGPHAHIMLECVSGCDPFEHAFQNGDETPACPRCGAPCGLDFESREQLNKHLDALRRMPPPPMLLHADQRRTVTLETDGRMWRATIGPPPRRPWWRRLLFWKGD